MDLLSTVQGVALPHSGIRQAGDVRLGGCGSVVERLVHTEEVKSSNLLPPILLEGFAAFQSPIKRLVGVLAAL